MVGTFWHDRTKRNDFLPMNNDLLEKLKRDYPNFRFRSGKKFAFRAPSFITIGPDEEHSDLLLLHEVGHAILQHQDFTVDAMRVKMESEAWDEARRLADKYQVKVDENLIQDELDTYRDWLHQKSRCPHCGLTRFQTPDKIYYCPRCDYFRQLS